MTKWTGPSGNFIHISEISETHLLLHARKIAFIARPTFTSVELKSFDLRFMD